MPFEFKQFEIPGLILISPHRLEDSRGFFMETYKKSEFEANGISDNFIQDNYSHSVGGVIRGLHFQKSPQSQAKLVMVSKGEIFDVAVDIRKDSPTFGQWAGVSLSSVNMNMLYIPAGFAHGFCVMSEEVDFTYKVSAEYAQDLDRGIKWDDPTIGISWPISNPMLSEKDSRLPTLHEADID